VLVTFINSMIFTWFTMRNELYVCMRILEIKKQPRSRDFKDVRRAIMFMITRGNNAHLHSWLISFHSRSDIAGSLTYKQNIIITHYLRTSTGCTRFRNYSITYPTVFAYLWFNSYDGLNVFRTPISLLGENNLSWPGILTNKNIYIHVSLHSK